ncbi:MAG: DUF1330 domain-containing protein [Deltaproteobacteria bacterium]|nr:MAG: DUF1330 domain-containing protein [Deltaproteobacteria bacterium]TMA51740.1 MAG: DUF1330 domain-containing protein [Deltaproteobacteria bacterium]
MVSAVTPTPMQLQAMIETGPEGPIVMVNLLKYRAKAVYGPDRPESNENLSGREAYLRYGAVAVKVLGEIGAGILWMGQQHLVFIGGGEQEWDEVACVRYPSRQAFLQMIARPDYLAATYHRDAALERTALLCCSAGSAS